MRVTDPSLYQRHQNVLTYVIEITSYVSIDDFGLLLERNLAPYYFYCLMRTPARPPSLKKRQYSIFKLGHYHFGITVFLQLAA
jgi:hypothetical protein